MGVSDREGDFEVDSRNSMPPEGTQSKGNTPTWSGGVNTWDAWEE